MPTSPPSAPPVPIRTTRPVLARLIAISAAAWLLGGCAAGIMLGDDGSGDCRDAKTQADCKSGT